jgi:hypothetical protein
MAGSRPSFQKRQKEQKRREKQLAKQERRAQRKLEKPATDEFGNPVEAAGTDAAPQGDAEAEADAGESFGS